MDNVNAKWSHAKLLDRPDTDLFDMELLLRYFEIGFHSSIWDTGASTSRKWYTGLFNKPP